MTRRGTRRAARDQQPLRHRAQHEVRDPNPSSAVAVIDSCRDVAMITYMHPITNNDAPIAMRRGGR